MATYDELLAIATTSSGDALKKKITVALIVACDDIRKEADTTPNHANRLKWVSRTLQSPAGMAETMLWVVLAQNRAFTVAQITQAPDAAVQDAVTQAINLLAQE